MNTEEKSRFLAEYARKGAQMGNCGKMCPTCAFNPNQPHDPDFIEAVENAMDCLAYFGTFNCHTDDGSDAGKQCAGFRYAKQYFDQLEKSDES